MTKKTIYTIVGIVGLFVTAQLVADIGATKFVSIGDFVMPGGTFVFALTFTLRDIVHKRLGKDWAKAAIVMAAAMNVFMAAYLYGISFLAPAPFFQLNDQWGAIFAIIPAITIGSIVAELVSGLTDTEVYHRWLTRFPTAPQWSRVLVSNAISLPVDTVVFSLLAFVLLPPLFGAESMDLWTALARVASGQMLYKGIVAVASIPLIYTVKDEVINFSD
jgi:uncharacterized integral membrane protein (TIGR00697 family)